VYPQKTSSQNTAIQKCAQFLFHEARHQPVARPLPGQEGLQMARDRTVKNRRFRIAGDIRPKAFADSEVWFSGNESAIT
jgi:hypothetical protein